MSFLTVLGRLERLLAWRFRESYVRGQDLACTGSKTRSQRAQQTVVQEAKYWLLL